MPRDPVSPSPLDRSTSCRRPAAVPALALFSVGLALLVLLGSATPVVRTGAERLRAPTGATHGTEVVGMGSMAGERSGSSDGSA